MTQNQPAPTAAMILIGNELLSGRTRDINLAYVGERLAAHGVQMSEARIVPDTQSMIIEAVNTLRGRNSYVFTTGGIGPTHDDITADCMAAAFNVELPINEDARALLLEYWEARGIEPNDSRMRMARIPTGASLIANSVSAAPGFRLENVFVMAGVPKIMQAMFDSVLHTLDQGPAILSRSVSCTLGEGTLAAPLGELQQAFPDIDIGSYPGRTGDGWRVMLVARGTDEARLDEVRDAIEKLVRNEGG